MKYKVCLKSGASGVFEVDTWEVTVSALLGYRNKDLVVILNPLEVVYCAVEG